MAKLYKEDIHEFLIILASELAFYHFCARQENFMFEIISRNHSLSYLTQTGIDWCWVSTDSFSQLRSCFQLLRKKCLKTIFGNITKKTKVATRFK